MGLLEVGVGKVEDQELEILLIGPDHCRRTVAAMLENISMAVMKHCCRFGPNLEIPFNFLTQLIHMYIYISATHPF